MKTVYHFGYQGQIPDTLLAAVKEKGAILCDIRLVPRSRQPEWNQKKLAALFGDSYCHIPGLGNLNYKNGGPIQIADLDAGIEKVCAILEGRPIVLMCVCRDFEVCHRRVVANELANRGAKVEALVVESAPEQETVTMMALSVHQPFASQIASGAKTIEYRTWATTYRGPLLIVATKRPVVANLPTGKALCIVNLVDCQKDNDGGYRWELSDVRRIEPFEVKGQLGLYQVSAAIRYLT